MLSFLGNPEKHFEAIHIGGSNGKGSVAAMVAAALARSGLRIGLYTSPHLVDVRERMLVDGRPIPEAAFAQWTGQLLGEIERTAASFFEATTVPTTRASCILFFPSGKILLWNLPWRI